MREKVLQTVIALERARFPPNAAALSQSQTEREWGRGGEPFGALLTLCSATTAEPSIVPSL